MMIRKVIIILVVAIFSGYNPFAQGVNQRFNDSIIDAILYEDPEKIALPEDSIERNLLLSILAKDVNPEESANRLIAAQENILLNKRSEYYAFLFLVEGYFYSTKDANKAENLFLKAIDSFKQTGNKQMDMLCQNFIVRSLAVSNKWNQVLDASHSLSEVLEDQFPQNSAFKEKISLLINNVYGSTLSALSPQEPSYIPRAKVHLEKLIEDAESLSVDRIRFNSIGNLAFIFFLKGEYEKMIPLALQDLRYSLANGKVESACGLHITLSSAYLEQNAMEKATYHFLEAERLIYDVETLDIIIQFIDLSKKFYKERDYGKVLRMLERFNVTLKNKISTTSDTDYKFLLAENKLKEAEKKVEFLLEKNKLITRSNWLLALLLTTVILLFIMLYRLHTNQKIFRKKLELINQNLEAEVKSRTKKVYEQNQKMKQFSYRNSHLTRAPVARLIGLADLLSDDPETNRELFKEIKHSTIEVDKVIREINEILAEDDPTK